MKPGKLIKDVVKEGVKAAPVKSIKLKIKFLAKKMKQ